MIYNQTKIPKDKWRYGFRSSAATGCGWIATYNALRLMGRTAKPEQLIRYYTWQLPLIHGNLGTTVLGPYIRFLQWGFPVRLVLRRSRYDEIARESDACILFFHWREGRRLGAHFVALHHTDRGFVGYNTYRNSVGPDSYGDSLAGFLKKRKYFLTALIAIRKK